MPFIIINATGDVVKVVYNSNKITEWLRSENGRPTVNYLELYKEALK